MIIEKGINKANWNEIKDILPKITWIKSLDLSDMGLTEFPKMSHITINGNFFCCDNQLTSFKNCPQINGNFYCWGNKIITFKDCHIVNGSFISDFEIFDEVQKYSRNNQISLLEAQVELYNQQNKELLEHIDKFPDLVAYIRLKELNKLL